VFPSHVKTRSPKRIETLIVNGAECEPWITCDDRLMRERGEDIVAGARIVGRLMGAKRILFGVEDNKPEAAQSLRVHLDDCDSGSCAVVSVPTLYPAGGEKQLIRVLTGIEIPYGKLGPDFGVQCFNVGTVYAVARAVLHGEPLISRILSLAGNYATPGNYEVLIGTPMDALLPLGAPRADTDRIVMGGPMMGFALSDTSVPVVKATNCLLAMSPQLFPPPLPEMPCIRCGACTRACPMILQPHELYWYAKSKNFGKAQEYHLFDCIECGCCAYVCPSRIPLVDYYRFAKSEIRARERDKVAADIARERYEFRQLREEREKAEKAAKLATKAAETKAKLAQEEAAKQSAAAALSDASNTEKVGAGVTAPDTAATQLATAASPADLIAAAQARAAAKKAALTPLNTTDLTPDQQAQVAAAEARRAQAASPKDSA
jgi:electron transport complex protein RnfC